MWRKHLTEQTNLSDVIGRHGVAGETPGGDHHIITLLPEPSGPDAIHLPPDVVPDWLVTVII